MKILAAEERQRPVRREHLDAARVSDHQLDPCVEDLREQGLVRRFGNQARAD
jgi:hypothetical protein